MIYPKPLKKTPEQKFQEKIAKDRAWRKRLTEKSYIKKARKPKDGVLMPSKLKKQLWELFSRYIRLRDCLKTTGTPNSGSCYTCGRIYPFKRLQAGHFIPGRGNGILFDERGVHAQCYQCNIKDHGRWVEYEQNMLQDYGSDVVEELKRNKKITIKYTVEDYELLLETYSKALRQLQQEV